MLINAIVNGIANMFSKKSQDKIEEKKEREKKIETLERLIDSTIDYHLSIGEWSTFKGKELCEIELADLLKETSMKTDPFIEGLLKLIAVGTGFCSQEYLQRLNRVSDALHKWEKLIIDMISDKEEYKKIKTKGFGEVEKLFIARINKLVEFKYDIDGPFKSLRYYFDRLDLSKDEIDQEIFKGIVICLTDVAKSFLAFSNEYTFSSEKRFVKLRENVKKNLKLAQENLTCFNVNIPVISKSTVKYFKRSDKELIDESGQESIEPTLNVVQETRLTSNERKFIETKSEILNTLEKTTSNQYLFDSFELMLQAYCIVRVKHKIIHQLFKYFHGNKQIDRISQLNDIIKHSYTIHYATSGFAIQYKNNRESIEELLKEKFDIDKQKYKVNVEYREAIKVLLNKAKDLMDNMTHALGNCTNLLEFEKLIAINYDYRAAYVILE